MKHILITTIAAVVLVLETASADPIHSAVENGRLDKLQAELDKGIDPNLRNAEGGWTPLFFVRDTILAKLLIIYGADVNAMDSSGSTPLHWIRNKEVSQLLINAGADVNNKTESGRTPLHHLAFNYSTSEAIELLIIHGADPNAKSLNGSTPLHFARARENAEVLIAHGADVNAEYSDGVYKGRTPLHQAATSGYSEVVEVLINNGADLTATTFEGETPFDYAHSDEIADILSNHVSLILTSNRSRSKLMLKVNAAVANDPPRKWKVEQSKDLRKWELIESWHNPLIGGESIEYQIHTDGMGESKMNFRLRLFQD